MSEIDNLIATWGKLSHPFPFLLSRLFLQKKRKTKRFEKKNELVLRCAVCFNLRFSRNCIAGSMHIRYIKKFSFF
jgi:hypothetical protein